MKLTTKEKEDVKSRRKYLNITKNSRKLIACRKASIPSKGEQRVINFLKSENIQFRREWFFKGLYNYNKTQLLYFDFYLPDYQMCIEYDGEQHYSKDKTENKQANDFLKNAYCAKNGINLLRIKYTDFENIETIICKYFDSRYALSGI